MNLQIVRYEATDGTTRVYDSHGAPRTTRIGAPGSAEFRASFEAEGHKVSADRTAGTVTWLIRQCRASRQWETLAASTETTATSTTCVARQ